MEFGNEAMEGIELLNLKKFAFTHTPMKYPQLTLVSEPWKA